MKQNYIVMSIVIIIVGVIAFVAGIQYQKLQRGQMIEQISGGKVMMQVPTGQVRMMQKNDQTPVIGEIISQDDASITVKMEDGSSKIIILSNSTAVNKQASGSKSDLLIGENVMVVGSNNADGSITAQNIQLNPQIRTKK